MTSRRMRTADPWDKVRDDRFNVFTERSSLNKEVRSARASHWAPNCATFTAALSIPIRVRNGATRQQVLLDSLSYSEDLFAHKAGHSDSFFDFAEKVAELFGKEIARATGYGVFGGILSTGAASISIQGLGGVGSTVARLCLE